ncbi:hypothetical protein JX266_002526 [Neoarthrinium moseri]|uniref:uncharacterized protein n=1 Tax=Neoarthrinium moseri TaxID=1658444 RepID=UPI001FDADA12|nr:uncharacterized protein JN550_008212 [Neoarthrinium moseri]KAI1852348.1 hypothetical protein JX266_002526 [Neoarthrinium moseri]KAI1865455.1 hypothetical protein JN550_008212 [Neoarthrinium moseri]
MANAWKPLGYGMLARSSKLNCVACPMSERLYEGYKCDGGVYGCTRDFGSTITISLLDLDSNLNTISRPFMTRGMDAHLIKVRYASSDLLSATTTGDSTSTSTSTSSTLDPTASTTSGLPTATASPSPGGGSSEGLTTGAKAGIGVGVAIGALAILGLVFFMFRRRGRKSNAAELDNTNAHYVPPGLAEQQQPYAPADYKYPSELANTSPPAMHELDSQDSRFETPRQSPGFVGNNQDHRFGPPT